MLNHKALPLAKRLVKKNIALAIRRSVCTTDESFQCQQDLPKKFKKKLDQWRKILEDEKYFQHGYYESLPYIYSLYVLKRRGKILLSKKLLTEDEKIGLTVYAPEGSHVRIKFLDRELDSLEQNYQRFMVEPPKFGSELLLLSELKKLYDGKTDKNNFDLTNFFAGTVLSIKKAEHEYVKTLMDIIDSPPNFWTCSAGYEVIRQIFNDKSPNLEANTKIKAYTENHEFKILKMIETNKHNFDQALSTAADASLPLILINGPPGSLKLPLATEILVKLIKEGKKILVSTPSFNRIYKILDDLLREGIDDVCIIGGDPNHQKSRTNMQRRFFKQYYSSNPKSRRKFLNDIRPDIDRNTSTASIDSEIFKSIDNKIVKQSKILFSTMRSKFIEYLIELGYSADVQVIDSAQELDEPTMFSVLRRAPRTILIGDYMQTELADENVTAYRQFWQKNVGVNIQLDMQFRSTPLIFQWSNQVFYEDGIKNSMTDEKMEVATDFLDSPLLLLDVDGTKYPKYSSEAFDPSFNSYYNTGEALVVVECLRKFLSRDSMALNDIGCITEWDSQIVHIKWLLRALKMPVDCKDLMVGTTRTFKSHCIDRDLILMSTVTKPGMQPYLLSDRITPNFSSFNIAITRARRKFILISSYSWMKLDKRLCKLVKIIEQHGKIVPARDLVKAETIEEFEEANLLIENKKFERSGSRSVIRDEDRSANHMDPSKETPSMFEVLARINRIKGLLESELKKEKTN